MIWLGCLCVAITIVISIIVLCITLMHKKETEKYKLMQNLGVFPDNIGTIKPTEYRNISEDDDNISLKYRGHRYERQKVRYHAPNKIYQQTQY